MSLYPFLVSRLKQPYPQPFTVRNAGLKATIAGMIVALVDLVFQPFGLAEFRHPHKFWVLLGFGVPVAIWVGLPGVLLGLLFPRHRREQQRRWTLWKQILVNIIITFGIAGTLFFYSKWIGFIPFTSVGYLLLCSFSFAALITIFFVFFDKTVYLTEVDKRAAQESEELKMLLRESHHRMRNHLQVIASILRLQTNTVTDARALNALRTSEKRLESIAILHEKLYKNENVSTVDLCAYLEELTRIIAHHHAELIPNVAIKVDNVAALNVSLDTAVPLGLIVNELITNSFKHAFYNMGDCRIQLILDRTDDGRNRLTVRDNGPGIPNGIMNLSGASLGMRLVKALTQQLRGQLSYRQNDGAEFVVQF
ncbi:sensor histidine kinase [Fibrella sp. HMF5335]|uniref:histidine kinase n=1 Tax=Fibrella rubiginis TaxID=2817060 RepID=A0A939K7D6_9BACT|nr:sensor histidine kinase [Fibrella rubiginis]MBO0939833.1 sensor histidine kinase [Fibrella rubiginis]